MRNARSNEVVQDGRDYARDSFGIHTEQRLNGWGFRIRSTKFFMIYCMGGFAAEDQALWHASQFVDFLNGNSLDGPMKTKGQESVQALPGGQLVEDGQEAPPKKRKRAAS